MYIHIDIECSNRNSLSFSIINYSIYAIYFMQIEAMKLKTTTYQQFNTYTVYEENLRKGETHLSRLGCLPGGYHVY